MRQPNWRWWFSVLSISLMVVCTTLTACTTTPSKTNETTPPAITWRVLNSNDNTTQTFTGKGGVIQAKQGTEYTITLRADDPGGVRQITLGSAFGWECVTSGVAMEHGPSDNVTDTQNFSPDSQGNVSTEEFKIATFTANSDDFPCQPGWNRANADVGFIGTSTNFSNKEASSGVDFQI